ncbi:MAG: hypothetical protein ACI9MC_000392 [Kiritimatiellia bacterium]|jgi:hypothetical protein
MSRFILPLLIPLTFTIGCQSQGDTTSVFQDVGMSFEPCNPAEIKWMNKKHDIMSALKVCGSNNIARFVWNPAGTHLYFDLTHNGNVLDASQDHKPLTTLPVDLPTGKPAWINNHRLAIPVVPDHKDKLGRERIAIYDIDGYTLDYKLVKGLTGVDEVSRTSDPSTIYFTAADTSGDRRVYNFDLNTSTASLAFDWLSDPVDTFAYTPANKITVVGRKNEVSVYSASGAKLGSYSPAIRGTMHPKGEWLALEHEGEEVSVFYQRAWEGMSRREREIQEKKAAKMAEKFPDWYPKTVKLPTISFVHTPSGRRGEVRSFFGTRFQWYESHDFYASFLLWGYEGKQLNRNVMLGEMVFRLYPIEHEKEKQDVRMMPQGASFLTDGAPQPPPTSSPAAVAGQATPVTGEIPPK